MESLAFSDPGFWKKLARFCEPAADAANVADTVAAVIADIRKDGDQALSSYTEKFDGAKITAKKLRVSQAEMQAGAKTLKPAERRCIREAIASVKDFHRKTLPRSWRGKNRHGATVGEEFYPIRRVGLYIPGGQVPLVSSVLMTAIPAVLAGCPEICVCTPPQKDGSIAPGLLAALHLAGVKEVYRAGGIQAIAAMGLGTKTLPPVDKIFGPGNAYVMEAKRQLFGTVGIDLLPGPSEVLILCDETANPRYVAADLLAQAEHGTGKEKVYLICTGRGLLPRVLEEVESLLPQLTHAKKIAGVLTQGFLAIEAGNLEEAAEVANFIAPEHMELHVKQTAEAALVKEITTAGAILLGEHTPTVLGDFTAGPSHTLPTGRTGRFFSGLQVTDFMRRSSIVRYDAKSLSKAAETVDTFSRLEQLDAHGLSLKIRLGG